MDEDRNRTLRIEIPPAQFGKATEEPEWTLLQSSNGWSPLPGSLGIYWEGTIDLSGYARDYKTFYPAGGVVQEGPYSFEVGGSGSRIPSIAELGNHTLCRISNARDQSKRRT